MRGAFRRQTPAQLMTGNREWLQSRGGWWSFHKTRAAGTRGEGLRAQAKHPMGPSLNPSSVLEIPGRLWEGTPSGPHLPQHLLLRAPVRKEGLRSSRDRLQRRARAQDVVGWVIICYRKYN